MIPARRMGPKGSEVWSAMLDAAEQILQEEGYGMLTSRSLAERAGVKQRLVYYYFATMDELVVEAFDRLAPREIERLEAAQGSALPLHEMWKVFAQTTDTRLVSEFMALANRIDALRERVAAHIVAVRALQVAALERAFAASGRTSPIPLAAAVILANAAALAIHREAALGLTEGHDAALKVIADFITASDTTP